jgi:metal-responsive CopG/Arc/MetJ family transcriptional regulator
MKIAISINNALLKEVNETAQQMRVSRNKLFGLAITDFLRRQRMLLQLNAVYSAESADKSLLNKIRAKAPLTIEDRW